MNSKTVLSKIMSLLNLEEAVSLTDAKTEDGTILQSSNFDVNDDVFEVAADGTKTPPADGDYTISFTTPEGEQSMQVITVKAGKIAEISTPEEETTEETEMEMVPVEEIPQASGDKLPVNETPTQKNSVKSGTLKMAEQTDTAEPIAEDTNAPEDEIPTEQVDMNKMMEDMQYRISEMEAKMTKMEEAMYPPVNSEVTEEVAGMKMEEELPKLDGAPIEQVSKFSTENKNNYGKKSNDSQSNFLSKLYN
jgi:hypothetical protein